MTRPLPPLAGITAPALVLLSKGVTYVAPTLTREIVGQFPREKTVAIDAHHWPLTEKPEETREAIEAWCAELDQV